jgi:putative intracellular protease/amidase
MFKIAGVTVTRTGKILLVLTSHDRLGDTGRSTGFYLPEAAHPWHELTAAGYSVDLISPAGGKPPIDGADLDDPVQRAFLDDPAMSEQLADTRRPEAVDAAAYDAIFFAGGHGTMWDFRGNATLAGLASDIYQAGGVVGAVCHGPAGLVDVTLADGSPLVAGKRVAAFTNAEERAVGLTDVVPFLLADALTERGAKHEPAPEFTEHVVVDGRLVTGQNPASAAAAGRAVAEVLGPAETPPNL